MCEMKNSSDIFHRAFMLQQYVVYVDKRRKRRPVMTMIIFSVLTVSFLLGILYRAFGAE